MTAVPTKWGTSNIPAHPEVTSLLLKAVDLNLKPYEQLTPVEARKQMLKYYEYFHGRGEFKGTVKDKVIPSPQVKGGIPVRIYRPNNLPQDPVIMVYFHGGGHVLKGTKYMHQKFSVTCKCIVVDVDYRLAPEHKLPAGLEDCAAVTEWVLHNRPAVGGSPKSLVGVAGDSAGGQASIYCTYNVKGLDYQILIYPWTDVSHTSPSAEVFETGPMLTLAFANWLRYHALPEGSSWDDPRWSPIHRESCRGLPPALVLLAELDPIRDDGRVYAKKLIDNGVPTTVYEVKGAIHTFISVPDHFKELTDEAYGTIATFLQCMNSSKKNK